MMGCNHRGIGDTNPDRQDRFPYLTFDTMNELHLRM
jgi:hypothetical protein